MRRRRLPARPAIALIAVLAASTVLTGTAVAGAPEAPSRIVAIGDIHGAYERLVEILQRAQLIDADLEWIGGGAVLVQTGDMVDKGPDIRRVMDLLIGLQVRAAEHGGRVIVLLGNHEAMNLMGIARDIDPEAYQQFVEGDSEKRRNKAYKAHMRLTRKRVNELGMAPRTFDAAAKAAWMEEHPLGWVEYREAMSAGGPYGRWLRSLPLAAQVGDLIFIHAGIALTDEPFEIDELNRLVREDVRAVDAKWSALLDRQVVLPFYSWEELERAIVEEFNGYRDRSIRDNLLLPEDREHMLWLAETLELQGGSLTAAEGPLWYRGFALSTDEAGNSDVEILALHYGVRGFVSAHTPNRDGRISQRFDGRIFLLDTGMQQKVYDGRASALEIEDGRFRAIYPDGEEIVYEFPASAD